MNDRIHKLLLIIIGKIEDQDEIVTRKSTDWLRFKGNNGIFSIYYKFMGNFGLGLSSITLKPEKNVCIEVYDSGACRTEYSIGLDIRGTFLNLGYDLSMRPIVFSINF